MTDFLVDVSRWQVDRPDPLDLVAAKAAGFTRVNIALTKGTASHWPPHLADAPRRYVDRARALGMGLCFYHWLNGSASGATQAQMFWSALQDVGGPVGVAHQLDCEDSTSPATETIWRDYVNATQDRLGRHLINYSGDWWWTAAGRNWLGAELTPYLWAAPNDGYLTAYPGDDARDWRADQATRNGVLTQVRFGGWTEFSGLQYAVAPLPGTGDCSLTAFRDPNVWAALTGEPMATSQNGWTASPDKTAIGVVSPTVAGVTFPQGVRGGDVATVLMHVAKRFHETVEPLRVGECWGYFYRTVSGGTSLSNHSSGTAIDLNAPNHPLGAVGTFSAKQVTAIRTILSYCDGCVRWGGDYSVRKDEMHFEIVKGAAAVATLARKITGGMQPVPVPPTTQGDKMLLIKTKDNATVWRSDGIQRVAMTRPVALTALVNAGHKVVTVDDLGDLEDAAGPLWTPLVDVDTAAVVAGILAGLTPQAIAAAVAAALPADLAQEVADLIPGELGDALRGN